MSGADVLQFVDEEMLRLPGPGPWISVKRFSTSRPVSRDMALETLIGHPDYLDFYWGDHLEGHGQDAHGPYRPGAIEVLDFKRTSTADALAALRAWLEELYEGQEPAGTSQSVVDWITPRL